MSDYLPFIVVGLATGSLYGMTALGLVLTYRSSGVFNFGHGAIAAVSAYFFFEMHFTHGIPWPIAGVVSVLVVGVVLGLMVELVMRRLSHAAETLTILATVGIYLGIQGVLGFQFGVQSRRFPDFLPTSGFVLFDVRVTWSQIITIAITLAALAGLYVFLQRSRLGVAMRAVVDDPVLVQMTGESPQRVRVVAWVIGTSFAALSGILLAPTLSLDAILLSQLVVQAFGACAFGLFRSLPLTYLGGLVIGVAAALSTKVFTDPPLNGVPPSIPFLVLMGVLLIVPVSRLRSPGSDRPILSLGESRRPGPPVVSIGVLGAALIAVPFVVGTELAIWINGLHMALLFGSLALLVWVSGQISLCQAAFAAVGATTLAHLSDAGVPWLPAVLLAALATVPIGALVALPAIRLSGLHLALVTLGFGVLMQNVVYGTFVSFGSELTVSVSRPVLGPLDGTDDRTFYFISLAIVAACFASLWLVYQTRQGRLLRALSQTPTMLATHGLSTNVTRLTVFCMSAFFAGLAGALTLSQTQFASGIGFTPSHSLLYLVVLALCGTSPLRSPMLAAALFAIVPGYFVGLDFNRQSMAFGLLAVVASMVLANRAQLSRWLENAARLADRRLRSSPVAARDPSPAQLDGGAVGS